VSSGGVVQGKPGLSLPSSILDGRLPTDEDRVRLEALRGEQFDILAISFVRSAFDIVSVRTVLSRSDVMMMAKIETSEGIENLSEIIEVSDAIMVARGDLGVRLPIEEVPHLQKEIVLQGIRYARPVVVATQMLESMTHAQVPTRAEVTDVANAVLDGTSAVMLSGETAVGADPVNVVATMARIVARTERDFDYPNWGKSLGAQEVVDEEPLRRITASVTGAAWRAAFEQSAVAIIACTQSGATARAISRFRPSMPIVAVTPSERTLRQLSMSWGVEALLTDTTADTDEDIWRAIQRVVTAGYAASGDVVIVLAGSPYETAPVADTMRIVRIP
jgi:pyruvate kinase